MLIATEATTATVPVRFCEPLDELHPSGIPSWCRASKTPAPKLSIWSWIWSVRLLPLEMRGVIERTEVASARSPQELIEILRKVVKDNGFVSKEAHLSARGTVVERGMQAVLTVAGTGETFALSAGPAANTAFDELRRRAHEAPVMVDELKGTADPPTNRSAVMTVESVR